MEDSKSITHSEESRENYDKLEEILKSGKHSSTQEHLKILILDNKVKYHKKADENEDFVRFGIKDFKRSNSNLKMRNRISKSERDYGKYCSRTDYRADNQILN